MEKKPAIRFEEYTEDWEQRKVLDVAPLQRGFDLPASQMEEGEYPVVMSNGVGGYHKDYKVKGPGVITGRSGTIGKVHYIEGNYWPHNTSLWVTDFNGNYPKFIYHLYQRLNLSQFGSGSGVPTLNRNDVHDSNVLVPLRDEQVQITRLFDSFDNLITLHQSNYEKMVATKKSMLDKLFPQGDAKVPAIRFEGFVGDWKKKPLSSIVIPYSDPVEVPHDGYERLGIRSHGKGVFHEYVEAGKEITSAQLHRVAAHNFIVNITFAWEHAVAVTCDSDAGKLVSHRFPQFSMADGIHDQFLKYLILDARFRHHLLLSSPGGAGRNRVLKIPEMLEYEMRIPDIDEQKQIAGYLNSLDDLIELYRIRVEKLKNIKAACLQGMFV